MKGLILAGGKGSRLRPITYTQAKQLVPVANKPILFFGIEAIRDAGIREIGIVVGDTEDEIRRAVGDGRDLGVEITYIRQESPDGLAHAVKISRDFLGDDPFVMYLGDNLIADGVTQFVQEFRDESPNAQILLARVTNPSDFGVAEIRDEKVVGLEEKPANPKSDFALVGVYLFDPNVFRAVDAIQPSARGELEITDAIQYLIDEGFDVRSHVIKGWWKDTGKLTDMLEANRVALSGIALDVRGTVDDATVVHGAVIVEEGATVVRSELRGPLIVGAGSVIEEAYIGPFTSVSAGCRIVRSEIEFSIVLENSVIESLGRRMEGSLIGKDARITQGPARPAAYRFMVGDNCEIQVPE